MRDIRRHHRERAVRRRKRIVLAYACHDPAELDHHVMNWHLKCKCFTCPAEHHAERRRNERMWKRELEI